MIVLIHDVTLASATGATIKDASFACSSAALEILDNDARYLEINCSCEVAEMVALRGFLHEDVEELEVEEIDQLAGDDDLVGMDISVVH